MDVISLDFETFYSQDYSLSKITTEEYVRDPRFQVIGIGVKVNDRPTTWFSGSHGKIKEFVDQYDWANSAVLAHNMMFDGAILSWRFGIRPKVLFDTLCMARAIHGVEKSASLKALAENDDNAVRAYTGATTAESITTPIDFDLIRLVEAANPLGAVFGTGVTPASGMTITFAQVDSVTDGTGVQSAEGDDLGYYELNLGTSTENIVTLGNYSELSRQVIDRSSVDYLNSVLRGQAIALGKSLAGALRSKYQAVAAAQVTAGNKVTLAATTYDGWVAGLADASATYFTPNGVTIDALIVDTATFKDLLALDGTPVISFSGEAAGAVGSANVAGLRGTIAGIPIVVDAGLDAVNKDECAFVSSLALRQYTSGALRLTQENAVNLSEAFSISTYTATADEYPAFIIPIDQTA
jgi:hypothetical protein